ncbi:MAG: thiamine diphosphokinase [Ignavibacterium sp.]|nr:thiamine diphosphokinase [Ignavibacterium sp.]MDW8376303.1 thiamine diphosphokinase [Ignavibacteriales bacterium]
MKKCIIIANGKAPKRSDVIFFLKKGYDTIFCADGGANSIRKIGLAPNFIIGDFDSVSKDTLNYFKDKSAIINFTRQTDTDVEKCLKFAIKKKFSEAILFGVTGDRLDHIICNLAIVIKFFDKIKCSIVAEKSFLSAFNSYVELKTKPNETISIYAFDDKTKITSKGLKYPLKNSTLPFGKKESTSNVAVGDKVSLKIKNGIAFVIREMEKIKKYDLI